MKRKPKPRKPREWLVHIFKLAPFKGSLHFVFPDDECDPKNYDEILVQEVMKKEK